jgi:phosphotransferase family enzyme
MITTKPREWRFLNACIRFDILDGSNEYRSLMSRIGHSLAVIHRDLVLPDEMIIAVQPEFALRGTEVFLHGDFNGANVCVTPDSSTIVILDWQMTGRHGGRATYGSRYFDIIWFINYMLWTPTTRLLLSDPVTPAAKLFIQSYFQEAGTPFAPDMFVPYAKRFFEMRLPSRNHQASWKRRWLLPRSNALTLRFIESLGSLRPSQ